MDTPPGHLQSVIETRLRERRVFGLAVCGFDRDGVRFAGGFGYADLERSEPVRPATVFRVASVSKLLTATLVLRGVDTGVVDLDAPVNRYLPTELRLTDPDGADAASTVGSLLSHTSGLPAGVRGAEFGNRMLVRLVNGGPVPDLTAAIRGLRTVRGPGERVVYSNPAFNVAGQVAATAFDASFETAATDQVLGPLGMADSEFTPARRGAGVATPYGSVLRPGPSTRPIEGIRLVATPMGGLTTHVLDLARFGRMVLNGGRLEGESVLSPDLVRSATSVHACVHPDMEQGYGLGFRVRSWRGRTMVGHDGAMPGATGQLALCPDDGVGVVVLANGYALAVPHEIATLALDHLLGLGPEHLPGSPDPLPEGDRGPAGALARRAEGTYRLRDAFPPGPVGRLMDLATPVRVTAEPDGRLRVDGYPGSDGPMWLLPDGRLGHYRVAAHVDDGTNAVLEEREDGTHLWFAHHGHLRRRR